MATDSEIVKELITLLTFKVTGQKAIEKYEKSIKNTQKKLERLNEKASKAGVEAFKKYSKQVSEVTGALQKLGLAVVGTTGGILALVKKISVSGDTVAKNARRYGIAADEMQKLQFAAKRSSVPIESLNLAFKNQARFLKDAETTGVTPFTQALDELGIQVSDLQNMTASERFGLIGERLKTIQDPARRTALAMRTVGEEAGPRLTPLLLEGRKGLKALGNEAEKLGLVMDKKALAASERLEDSFTNATARAKGFAQRIAVGLFPVVEKQINQFENFVEINKEIVDQHINDAIELLGEAFKESTELGKSFLDSIRKLSVTFGSLGNVVKLAIGAFAGFKAMLFAIANPMGALLTATTALGFYLGHAFVTNTDKARESTRLLKEETEQLRLAQKRLRDQENRNKELRDDIEESEKKFQEKLRRRVEGFDPAILDKSSGTGLPSETTEALTKKINDRTLAFAEKERRRVISKARKAGVTSERAELLGSQAAQRVLGFASSRGGLRNLRRAASEGLFAEGSSSGKAIDALLRQQLSKSNRFVKGAGGARKEEKEELPFGQVERVHPLTGQKLVMSKERAFVFDAIVSKANAASEDAIKNAFQALIKSGKDVGEATRIAESEGQRIREQQLQQLNTGQSDPFGDRQDLLATLSGGRLTTEKFGMAEKPGFGAQIVNFNVDYKPVFDTDVNIGSLGEASLDEVKAVMQEEVVEKIDTMIRISLRQSVPQVEV